MTFLIDNQLPPALAAFLTQSGHISAHVCDLGIETHKDVDLLSYATTHGHVVVSKDSDFRDLVVRSPASAPLVWVRLGNCRTPVLFNAFGADLPRIVRDLTAGVRVVEIK